MKMVAASKLRRAQQQAEAARPYAERMERMLDALAAAVAGVADRAAAAGGHRQGPGASADRGDRRSRPGRRVQHHVGRADPHRSRGGWRREGKTVKILAVGRKGRDYLRRELASRIVGDITYRRQASGSSSPTRRTIAERITAMLDGRRVRCRTVIYNRFHSVIAQVVDRAAADPGAAAEGRGRRRTPAGAIYEFEPDEETILAALLPQNLAVQIYPRAAGKRRRRAWRADDRDGQRDPQRRRHDQAADAELQPRAPGQHHHGN